MINYNGDLYPADKPLFTSKNRAFLYGDCIFETIRIYNGNPLFFNKHRERLLKGMKKLGMDPPEWFKKFFLFFEIKKTIEANSITKGGRVRLTVFREEGGFYTPENNGINFLIEAMEIDHNKYMLNNVGLKIGTYTELKKPCTDFGRFKTGNSLLYVLAGIFKKEQQWDDVLILNYNSNYCEAISSNIFCYHNKKLYTPAKSENAVNGIMQRLIIEIAEKEGIEVEETIIPEDLILSSRELFLTNTIKGIQWVNKFEDKLFNKEVSGMLVEKLNESIQH